MSVEADRCYSWSTQLKEEMVHRRYQWLRCACGSVRIGSAVC